MLEVRDETWHNAVEGYLGNNKLSLMVEPAYAKEAMEIYETMDKKKFWRARRGGHGAPHAGQPPDQGGVLWQRR